MSFDKTLKKLFLSLGFFAFAIISILIGIFKFIIVMFLMSAFYYLTQWFLEVIISDATDIKD